MVYYGTIQFTMGYYGMTQFTMVYFGIVKKKKKKSGIVQFTMVWCILPRYSADCHGIL